jgi:hypothetical protein
MLAIIDSNGQLYIGRVCASGGTDTLQVKPDAPIIIELLDPVRVEINIDPAAKKVQFRAAPPHPAMQHLPRRLLIQCSEVADFEDLHPDDRARLEAVHEGALKADEDRRILVPQPTIPRGPLKVVDR